MAAKKDKSYPIFTDYQHATKIFRANKFQYAPRLKFQFHVYFDIDPQIYFALNTPPDPNPGLMVKSVKLPQYTIQTHQMNQYNRKRIVTTKIKYDPVNIVFHDDNSNTIRNMWYNYYSYYFDDPNNVNGPNGQSSQNSGQSSQTPIKYDFTQRDQYLSKAAQQDYTWGYVGEGNQFGVKSPFFRAITIYGFNQKTYVAYTLINPVITSFQHDNYAYSEGGGTMENQMGLDYEFVKYDTGSFNGTEPSAMIPKFAEASNYDFIKSPLPHNGGGADTKGDSSTPNRDTVPGTSSSPGYNTTSSNPYASRSFDPSNIDNGYSKNKLTTAETVTKIPSSEVSAALSDNSVNTGRNILFSSSTYGSTPSSTGVADTNVNPGISKNSDAIIEVGPLGLGGI